LDELSTEKRTDLAVLADSYSELGAVLRSLGQEPEAERAFRIAIENFEELVVKFPDMPKYWLNLGHTHRWLNQQAEAATEFSKAIEKWPNDGRFLHWRAAALSSLGQHDKAVADLREAARKGYTDVAHLKSDASFDPLRSREDFNELLRDADERNQSAEDQRK
jgi:tetratricopeptide (TPR) repeat protein